MLKSSAIVGREEMRKEYVQSRDSAARGGTAHRAGAGGDDTGGAIASGVAGDPATHWAQAAARAAAAGATARGAAAAGDAGAAGLAAHRLAAPGPAAAGDAACRPAAAGATAGATAGGAGAARDAAGGARAGGLAADGAAAAGHTTAGAVAGGPAAGGLAAAGGAAGLLTETSAAALVRADGATTGADHGVRGWRFWVSFQESEFLESETLLGPQSLYTLQKSCYHDIIISLLLFNPLGILTFNCIIECFSCSSPTWRKQYLSFSC